MAGKQELAATLISIGANSRIIQQPPRSTFGEGGAILFGSGWMVANSSVTHHSITYQ
jgi:hypothetical protein